MSKLNELIKQKGFILIVEVTENNPELIDAAVRGGADAIQILIKDKIEEIKAVSIPVGVVLAKDAHLKKKQFEKLTKVDFINLGIEHISPFIINNKKLSKILALDSRFSFDEIIELSKSNFELLDAAIIPISKKGKALDVGDLQNYISIIISSGLPVIIPTQCRVHPSEVAILADTGAKGLILTSIVTGKTVAHIEKTTREFKSVIDDLEVRKND